MIETKLVCQNLWCQKVISPTKSCVGPTFCACCSTVFCFHCFEDVRHSCENRKTLFTDHSQSVPCSRCRTRLATFQCMNCNNEQFCLQCCRSVHSVSKFSCHSIASMTSVKKLAKDRIQMLQTLSQFSQKQNFQISRKLKFSQKIEENGYLNKNQNLSTLPQIQHKIDNSLFLVNMRKSEAKIQELTLKEKWAKIEKSVDDVFKALQQKVVKKWEAVKNILNQQAEKFLNQTLKQMAQVKLAQVQVTNMKSLLNKNKKSQASTDLQLLRSLDVKLNLFQEKLKSFNDRSNSKDMKHNISKEFVDHINKIGQEIESLNVAPLIKNESLVKVHKNDECLGNLKQKQKKKVLLNSNKSKNGDAQTAKKILNISIPNNENYLNQKHKKRKISIELCQTQQMTDTVSSQNKSKQLQRIKSFDFLSSTNSKTSLESLHEIKTEKKIMHKFDNTNLLKRYPSNQELTLSFIRNKIENSNLNFEGNSDNFIKTSSELLASTQTLPPLVEVTILKPSLYSMTSPKNSTAIKQKSSNSNKTFSCSINSPSSKATILGFKSPNAKARYLNDSKQQGFCEIQLFDSKTLKKNPSNKIILAKE